MSAGSILIVGGGTGGHIGPGIALYEEMKFRSVKALFLTGKRDRKFSLLKEVAKEDLYFYGAPPMTKNVFKFPVFLIRFAAAILRARIIIRKNRVSAIVGMGGYVSAPALIAAAMKKVPIHLCEQNVIPGKVTSYFEKHCTVVYSTFAETQRYMKFPEKFMHVGNPIRKSVFVKMKKADAKKAYHMPHANKIVLIIGGSQGAMKINDIIFELKKKYPDQFHGVGIIWSAGSYSYERFKSMLHEGMDAGSIYLSEYIENVGTAYRAADLAVSRAGAGVMMELAAFGVPSILIPYPHAALDHQEKNADAFEAAGAGIKIKEDNAVEGNVAQTLFTLLNNDRQLKKLSDRALAISKSDAAQRITDDIIKRAAK